MWISLFVIVLAVSIGFGFAAVLMRDRDTIKTKMTNLLPDKAFRRMEPAGQDLDMPLASSTFAKALGCLRNMSAMMDRLGFNAEVLARQDLNVTSVFHDCQKCSADEVCHDWLVRAPKSLARAPAFCPNAKRFADARQVQV